MNLIEDIYKKIDKFILQKDLDHIDRFSSSFKNFEVDLLLNELEEDLNYVINMLSIGTNWNEDEYLLICSHINKFEKVLFVIQNTMKIELMKLYNRSCELFFNSVKTNQSNLTCGRKAINIISKNNKLLYLDGSFFMKLEKLLRQ